MVSVVTHYAGLNRILLLIVGLWPIRKMMLARVQFFFLYSVMISFVIFQFTTFVTSECNMELIIKVFSFTTVFLAFVMQYQSVFFNNDIVKDLVEQLQYVYDELKDENEIAIIEKYGRIAKRYTTGFTIIAVCGLPVCIGVQLWPDILDVILPLNQTRPHRLLFEVEYFVDQERYLHLIILHASAAASIGGMLTTATGTLFFTYFQYICSIFKIASYRIEHAMKIKILKDISQRKEILVYEGLIDAINIHRKAIEFSEIVISTFEIMMMFLIMTMVLFLSLNLFRVFQIVSYGNDAGEILLPFLLVIIGFSYMFSINYIGQQITDHNNHVFITAYNVPWYEASLHTQRLILFLLQRGSKTFGLNINGFFVMSLENFTTLGSTAISYFTILYSMQEKFVD